MADAPDISILICTLNRAASLKETLECLDRTERDRILVEVVVIDNNSQDDTRAVVESSRWSLPVRYLREEKPGKPHCLNRALATGGLGGIVAVLDDDMSPHPEWCRGVVAITKRWPDADMFSGTSYVIWPHQDVPAWAKRSSLEGWAFSVIQAGEKDRVLESGRTVSGNHWWFRSRVLAGGIRFQDLWLTEPRFMLDLAGEGARIVIGPDAVAGHRIQAALLQEAVLRERAIRVGQSFADVRLRPCRRLIQQAIRFKKHPVLARLFCLGKLGQWSCLHVLASLHWSGDDRLEKSLAATMWRSYYQALFRVASGMEEYDMFHGWRRRRTGGLHPCSDNCDA